MSNIKYSYDKDNMSYFAKQVPNPKKILNMDAVIPFSTLATFTNNMYNISEDSIKNDSKKELSIKHTIDVINTSIDKYDGSILKAQLLDKTIDNQSFDLYIDFSVKRRLDNHETSGSNKKVKIENNEHTLRRSDQDEHEEHEDKKIKQQEKIDKKDAHILAKKIKEQEKIDKKDAAILAKKIKEQDKIDKIQQKEDAWKAKILEREIAQQDKLDKIQQKQEEKTIKEKEKQEKKDAAVLAKQIKEKEKQDKKDAAVLAKQIKEKEKQDKKDAAILANISKLQAKIIS
jgi:hypothetical protein